MEVAVTAGLVKRYNLPDRFHRKRFRPGRNVTIAVAMLLTLGLTPHSAAALGSGPALSAAAAEYPFQDPSLSLQARVDDLVGRLTLAEKISLLHQYQPAIPRLGLKVFKTGTEALHGVAWSCDYNDNGAVVTAKGTTFPQALGLASTWDPALIKKVGSVVGDEARGYNALNPTIWGLNLWAPVVNLLRDPRWGRNEEGYSEDPYLTGQISTAYGKGMTGDDPDHLKAAPTLKHYLAYNNEVSRGTSSAQVSPRVLHEYDEAAFKPAIVADAATGVMPAYNLVNGRPNTVSSGLNEIRSWSDKPLFNVSDAGAPSNLTGSQAYFATAPEAYAAQLKAGLDSFTQDNTDPKAIVAAVTSALEQKLITEKDVDTAVGHALSIRFRLGEFDPDGGPYGKITPDVINAPAHGKLARQTAAEATVLLKNSGKTLPLNAARTKKVAVVGPLSDTLYTDWYGGNLPSVVTPLDGVKERLGSGATVTGSDGMDRIALRDVATGKYLSGGAGATGAVIGESATTAAPTAQFDAFDWGQGVLTLRNVANSKYIGYNFSNFVNDQAQPNGWFVQQMFKLEAQPDGNVVIKYVGYESNESWFGSVGKTYLVLQPDGTLNLGAATPAEATKFAKETIVSGVDSAVQAAKGADAAVVVVGSMPFINGREDHDRTTMDLAEGQEALVRAVRKANPNTVVVLENSYPTTLNWEQKNVPAILWTTHAGQETGHAVADVLFGDHNPSGRLTQTWYRSAGDLPDILDYDIIKSDRTYQYFKGTPLYPMGHGLSYSDFRYGNLRLASSKVDADGTLKVSVDVTNAGSRAGAEVVQLYTHAKKSRVKQPIKQLKAFDRVELAAGQKKTVQLQVKAADLAFWDVTRSRFVVETGSYDVMVGASSSDIRATRTAQVKGEVIPDRDLTRSTRAETFDNYQGVTLVDETKAAGTSIGAVAGNWVSYRDADLRRPATFTARVANAGAATSVEIRLGGPTGTLVGTALIPATGDVYTYTTVTAALSPASGNRDVYLVFKGSARMATFALK
jgi:beta-glucosidase